MHFPVSSACMANMAVPISTYGIRNSDTGILAVTARSWSKNRSLTSSLRPLCGAYTDRKVTTRWPTMSFTKIILLDTLWNSKTFSTLLPQTLLHQQCLCHFLTSRACTWCPCPWLCGSCHHGIWSPECSRHPLSCGIVFPLPRKLFLLGCSHWVFPPWISSGACWICHNGPTLPPTPDRRPSRRRYQQNICWHRLTLNLFLAHLGSAQDELLWSLFVRPCVRQLTFSNDFSSETAEPILLKFHMEPP